MQNPFREGSNLDVYQNRGLVRFGIVAIAFLISSASIIYTNVIVNQLRERERRSIDLYAAALEYIANEINEQNINLIAEKIIEPNNSIPVIVTNEKGEPTTNYRNIHFPNWVNTDTQRKEHLRERVLRMAEQHDPISLEYKGPDGEVFYRGYIYYENSYLLRQLTVYPYIQLTVIGIFAFVVYLAFNYSRRAEQNKVWVGLAKETAHQLGTPLSSLMAWIEYFRADEDFNHPEVIEELEKDVEKFRMITERFSNIGSEPVLNPEPMAPLLNQAIQYLRRRVSTKVQFNVQVQPQDLTACVNRPLFEWVIENLCKNAVDAMAGEGHISIHVFRHENKVAVDISDTGKGIPKGKLKTVFQPGFTTKQRGWGLGLTLVKRIVEQYHGGKIFVKHSEVDQGTTFRVLLKP